MRLLRDFSRKLSLWTALALSVMVVSLGSVSVVLAESIGSEKKGVSISPPLKEVVLGPGLIEAYTVVTLTNNSGRTLVANLRLVDLQSLDEFGGVSLGEVKSISTRYNLAKWLRLSESNQLTIPNGEKVQIPVVIQNAEEMAPGGHYGALIANIQPTDKESFNQISLRQELVSLLFIKKVGGETYELGVDSLVASGKLSIPDKVNIVFKNSGNVHVVPRGYVEVSDSKGEVIAKGIINPESTLVMPEKTREFITVLQPLKEVSASGKYKVTAYYRYDGKEKFATYSITYGKETPAIVRIGIGFMAFLVVGAGAYKLFLINKKRGRRP